MVELWKNIIFESILVKKIIEYYQKIKEEKITQNKTNENAEIKE
jgi:hypothetical protein